MADDSFNFSSSAVISGCHWTLWDTEWPKFLASEEGLGQIHDLPTSATLSECLARSALRLCSLRCRLSLSMSLRERLLPASSLKCRESDLNYMQPPLHSVHPCSHSCRYLTHPAPFSLPAPPSLFLTSTASTGSCLLHADL